MKKVECTMYLLGAPGVGKTTIGRYLSPGEKKLDVTHSTGSVVFHDLVIDSPSDVDIIVQFKEIKSLSTFLKSGSFISNVQNSSKFSIINFITDKNGLAAKETTQTLTKLKKLEKIKGVTVIVTLNKSEPSLKQNELFGYLTKNYSFINYWLEIPLVNETGLYVFEPYAFVIQQLLKNKCSGRLNAVRNLIIENLKSKKKVLDIGFCGLTSLREVPELFACTHLEELIISNEWGVFEKGKWVRKQSSNSYGPNVFSGFPSEIGKLKNLKVLIAGGNWKSKRKPEELLERWQISEITALSELSNLEVLNLSNNHIAFLYPLSFLSRLKQLYLNNNRIENFPRNILFNRLSELYLSNNKIRTCGFLKQLRILKAVDLHSNLIRDLKPLKTLITRIGISDSKWETDTISIYNNSLPGQLQKAVQKGEKAILAYYKQEEAEKNIHLTPLENRDIKLIIVGNSDAGKTTLIHWLTKNEIKRDIHTTHWMKKDRWDFVRGKSKYTVRIFDFGGQEYYHDTHHLFFTNRTAYLILWEGNEEVYGEKEVDQLQRNGQRKMVKIQNFPLTYWLEAIVYYSKRRLKTVREQEIDELIAVKERSTKKVAQKTAGSTEVFLQNNLTNSNPENSHNWLIVQNKVDSRNDRMFLNEKWLFAKYPAIFDFTDVSVFDNRGLDLLKGNLFNIFENMDIANKKDFASWLHIKKALEKKLPSEPMSLSGFKDFCNSVIRKLPEVKGANPQQLKSVLFDNEDTSFFADYLADVGLAMYYPENPGLRDKIYLNPDDIIQQIYSLLELVEEEKSGVFTKANAEEYFIKRELKCDLDYLLKLMLQFKIIFPNPSKKDAYIAPLYLPKKPNESLRIFFSLFKMPLFRYEYNGFIHKNVILDFFHEYGKYALKGINNNDNSYFWRDGIILKQEQTDEIILVEFQEALNKDKPAHVDVYAIGNQKNRKFLKDIVDFLDSIHKEWGDVEKMVSANGGDFIPVKTILENERNKNWLFPYGNKMYNLLDFRDHLTESPKLKKVFVSYSKIDTEHLQKLENHLSVLKRNGTIDTWNCRKLLPGEKWDGKIRQELESADVILFLVSDDFLATDYIWDVEIKKAIERDDDPEDNVTVIPIIIRNCDWQDSPLGVFNTAPPKALVINSSADIDESWTLVVKGLKKVLIK